MAVSKRLRYEVLRRDNHQCRYCGSTAPGAALTVDHVVPTALGGGDEPSNLVTACTDCNAGKSATPPDAAIVADADERAIRWAQALSIALERRAAGLAHDRAQTEMFDKEWSRWTVAGNPVPREANWKNSILRFLAAGLDHQFLADAIATSMGLTKISEFEKWRYFCGICWRAVDDIITSATAIADHVPEPPLGRPSITFPYVLLAEEYVSSVLEMVDAPPETYEIASNGIWYAMATTYEILANGSPDYDIADYPGPDEYCAAIFSDVSARDMYEIGQVCKRARQELPSGS